MQDEDCSAAYVPAEHAEQLLMLVPGSGAAVPAGQLVQLVLPAAAYVPAEQVRQEELLLAPAAEE